MAADARLARQLHALARSPRNLRLILATLVLLVTVSTLSSGPRAHVEPVDEAEEEPQGTPWTRLAYVNGAAQFRRCPKVNEPVPSVRGLPHTVPIVTRAGRTRLEADDLFIHRNNVHDLGLSQKLNRTLRPHLLANGTVARGLFARKRCAIVGNSGLLKASRYGTAIDSHQVVVRINHAPTEGFRAHVGSRTTARVLNLLWSQRYALGSDFVHTELNCGETSWKADLGRDVCVGGFDPKPRLPLERDAALLCSRVGPREFISLAQTLRTDRRFRESGGALLVSSHAISAARRLLVSYRVRLCASGHGPYAGGAVPSSGLVAVFLMLNLCASVDLYGFGSTRRYTHGSFKNDARNLQYHYFTGFGSRTEGTPVHSWEAELYLLERLANEGLINMCVIGGAFNTTAAAAMGADTGRDTCGMATGDAAVLLKAEGGQQGLAAKKRQATKEQPLVSFQRVKPEVAPVDVRAWMRWQEQQAMKEEAEER